jgi:hypothetical protein
LGAILVDEPSVHRLVQNAVWLGLDRIYGVYKALAAIGGIPSPSLNGDSNKDQHEHEIA